MGQEGSTFAGIPFDEPERTQGGCQLQPNVVPTRPKPSERVTRGRMERIISTKNGFESISVRETPVILS